MSKDLNILVSGQHDIHGRLSRAVDNLKKMGAANVNRHAVETRIRLLDEQWKKFEAQHDQIRAGYGEGYGESEYARSNLYDVAENTYVHQRSILAEYALSLQPAQAPLASAQDHTINHTTNQTPKTTLPRLKLPVFSGTFEDWPSFRDLFLSVVGENSVISNVERLHYLRSCLQGPAEKLIRPLTVTGDNYERAWAILSKHYENKKELIRSNFTTFTAVTKMKGETAEELSRIYHAVTAALNAQESIGRPIQSNGMDLFNHLVVELFDPRTRLEWESSISESTEPPDHDVLMTFITKRMFTLNAAKPKPAKPSSDTARSAKSHAATHSGDFFKCTLCKGKHSLMLCSEFKAKSAEDRKAFVEANRRYFNCLGNHPIERCRSTTNCLTCKSRHHTLLHDAYATPGTAEVSSLSAIHNTTGKAILLATARVVVADCFGHPHAVRVLIDQGSEVSIISESLVQRLRLPRSRSAISLFGVGCSQSGSTRGKVTVTMTSSTTRAQVTATAVILPRLTLYKGSTVKCDPAWPHLKGLPLADPEFMALDPIDILLGADVHSIILEEGLRKGEPLAPIAQKTSLGWILSGGSSSASAIGPHRSFQGTIDHELVELVHRFWEQEKEPAAPTALTPEEEECEAYFMRTHVRTTSGRYMVRLPFSSRPTNLSDTRYPAERLLTTVERKGERDPQFGKLYYSFMKEYEDLKHMEVINPLADRETNLVCYLPHHGVLRENSLTTKLRVVFNGSQRTRSGESLNAQLHVGANLLPALADTLVRWRQHRYVFVTDIEKMYRQILIHPEDRDYQRILWRHRATEDIRAYRLNTVTYGLASAPFLAIRTLEQLADDERASFPLGAITLKRDRYMDDITSGANTLSEAIGIQTQLRELCTAGGFPLRKWTSNCEDVLAGIPTEHRSPCTHHAWEVEGHATLGLRWHPGEDQFALAIHPRNIAEFTKRQVLAETARLFDPLGWLTPVTIRAKIYIQSAWLRRLDWDTPLPSADARLWKSFFSELPNLGRLRVKRWIGNIAQPHVELHGFADASERGYAAVVYLRVTNDSSVTISLLMAKSKVAPLKQVSLPRLELCAAALLATLTHHIRDVLSLSTASIFLWSDSRVTLHWIKGHVSRWKTYVANRVSQVQQLLPDASWRHVPGRDNPADCASRGLAPGEIPSHPLWWTGPEWLSKDQIHWPADKIEVPEEELPERRVSSQQAAAVAVEEPEVLQRFSSLQRLLRVTAWCARWLRSNAYHRRHHSGDATPTLQSDEIDDALIRWMRVIQSMHYSAEVAAIKVNRKITHRSMLLPLTPFLDSNGVLRVGGRLKHAILSDDERHPSILPPSSRLTQLVVESCHRRTLHGGVQLTLGLIRHRFWIPRGRATVRRLLHRCVTCARWRAAAPQPQMGNLPPGRVTHTRPFLRTGVDYAGPIQVRTTKGRGQRSHKAFIAVFVCMSSKAIHLEVASDYTSEAFLAAFRRFVSRRGLCGEMFSDCGTNFVGADRALRELFRASSPDGRRIAHAAATEGIKWHFNPPAAPHFGGLWEAAVKSTKHHLRRVIGETKLTFEEMSTFLAQVEACLNSRPLQALSDDPDDLGALTPGHFLIGAPLLAIPEPSLTDTSASMLSRWHHLQKMRDHFWERWSREYLQELQSRSKWFNSQIEPEVGAMCLIRSETMPPSRWPLARITQLHPGDDGVTRVVTVRTANTSELIRPITKIVLLPGAVQNSKEDT